MVSLRGGACGRGRNRRSGRRGRRRSARRRGTRPGRRTTAATGSWVTITMVWPNSRTAVRMNDRISAPVRESRLPVGSSAKMISGRLARARATATRCCWPPESSDGRCFRRFCSPTVSTTWSNHAGSGLRPARRAGSVMFSAAVSVGTRLKAWKMNPMRSRRSWVSWRSLSFGEVGVADEHGARREVVEPGEAVHQRRLARARRAHDGGEAAGGELDGHAVEGADLGLASAVDLDGVDDTGGGTAGGRRAPAA